jgi:CubicO group peptidase (beta-lactamase class C family)
MRPIEAIVMDRNPKRGLWAIALLIAVFVTIFGAVGAFSQNYHEVREAQTLLYRADYNPGPIDGKWGSRTETALVEFLKEQGVIFDGTLSENELAILRKAPVGQLYASRPYTANGRRISHEMWRNGITKFPGWELPQYLAPPPNDATLQYYFKKWLREADNRRFLVNPGNAFKPLAFRVQQSTFLENQLRYSSMISHLYYEEGAIVFDGLVPEGRFRTLKIDDKTPLRSASIGKSVVSYILGHAICGGYIESLDQPMSDWPLIDDTLYAKLTLLDVLNMKARDQHIVTEDEGLVKTGRWFNNEPLSSFVENELKGSKPNRIRRYNYNGLATRILINYVIFKTGADWKAFFENIFQQKVGIREPFYFSGQYVEESAGPARYRFYASRYDYLRIAISMLEDWQNETCVGHYLRDIYDRREPKNQNFTNPNRMTDVAKSYGGQFHFDFAGMKRRTIFGLNGYGGQNIMIDMDHGRIVVTNSAHTNFDWRAVVYEPIRTGRIPK